MVKKLADDVAIKRGHWIAKNRFYYENHYHFCRFLVPHNSTVLDLGCGIGDLLHELNPPKGLGIDISDTSISIAQQQHPGLKFLVGDIEDASLVKKLEGPFDIIVMSDIVGMLEDIATTFKSLHPLCSPDTRIIVSYYSQLWAPMLKLAEVFGMKQRQLPLNWLSSDDIRDLMDLADFEVVKREWRQLMPKNLYGIGPILNRCFGWLPGMRLFCLRNYLVARPKPTSQLAARSVSIIVPCKNERGNIESVVSRIPDFAEKVEIIFVEGHSEDGTLEEIKRVVSKYPSKNIRCFEQAGKGKGDAVRNGFANAHHEILMILDADLTVAPESLPQFYDALVSGKGEFVNGSRFVYPMEAGAMRFLNFLANRLFSSIFSWLLGQRLTDTLCGTKVLTKNHYNKIAANRSYFGEFDPFGDYDLLLGASKLNLKMVEIPVRYGARNYGETQIARFRDGWKLVKMVVFACRKLKTFC